MRKAIKKALAMVLTFSLLLMLVPLFPGTSVLAADISATNPSWWIGNGSTNPVDAATAYWTYYYGKDGNFTKMTYREGEYGKYAWRPNAAGDPELINAWSQTGSQNNWAVLGFSVGRSGQVTGRLNKAVYSDADGAEMMVVLKSADTGRFYPLYPTAGEWTWKTLTGTGAAAPDIVNTDTLFTTEFKENDTIYYLARPKGDNPTGMVNMVPAIDMTYGETTAAYPADAAFSAWKGDASTLGTSWFAQQNANPYPGSPYTFSYIDKASGDIRTMEKFYPVAEGNSQANWRSASGQSWAGSWYVNVSATESAAIVYAAPQAGEVTISDRQQLKERSGSGEYMIVQQNAKGDYYPLYPSRGVWEYQPLSADPTAINVKTYMATDDKLLMVYRSDNGTWTQIATEPQVTIVPVTEDGQALRPADGAFHAWEARQGLQASAVFGSNMVLQRGKPVNIFGSGAGAGDTVTVSFAGQTKTAAIEADGRWSATLDALQADSTGSTLTITHTPAGAGAPAKVLNFRDVLVGEVWLCAGQSNMEVTVNDVRSRYPELAALYDEADNLDSLRAYTQPYRTSDVPLADGDLAAWRTPEAATINSFSAIALGYAIHLQKALGEEVPVGVIVSARGGTFIEEWLDADTMASLDVINSTAEPLVSKLYNGMIHHFAGTTLAGLLWYQGENNASAPALYKEQFTAYAELYRRLFEDEQMPIISFQLVQYSTDTWPNFRQMQWDLMDTIDNLYTVCGIDLGFADDIHPGDKFAFSGRAAGVALKYVYDKPADELPEGQSYGLSPYPTLIETDGNALVLHVSDAAVLTASGGALSGFYGRKQDSDTWVALEAAVSGNTVRLTGDIADIVAVRYLQAANFTDVDFVYNEYGLPLAPFANFGIDGQTPPPLPEPVITNGTSWFVQQDENPWPGSPFTFGYLDNASGVIGPMEKYVAPADGQPGHYRSESEQSWLYPWYANASATESAAVIYTSEKAGTVSVADTQAVRSLSGKGGYMIVQQNAEGEFYPLYPTKGEWEFEALSATEHEVGVRTWLAAGDRLMVIYMSADGKWAQVASTPEMAFQASADDAGALRPADADFSAWQTPTARETQPEPEVSTTSWYVQQNVNPWPGSPFTFGYLNHATGVIGPMEKYVEAQGEQTAHYRSESEQSWLAGWYANASKTESAAVIYAPGKAGLVEIADLFDLKNWSGKGAYMIVQQNAAGNFYPVYPQRGVWEAQVLTEQRLEPDSSAYLTAEDKLILLYLSADGNWAQIHTQPQLSLLPASQDTQNLRPADADFTAWPETIKIGEGTGKPAQTVTFLHSGSFNDSDKQYPHANAQQGAVYFDYQSAKNGVFSPLDSWQEAWKAWTRGGSSPMVGSYFIGGSQKGDGALTWTAQADGSVVITSSLAIKKNNGDDALFMVVQERDGKFAPVWPVAGEFIWQEIDASTNITWEGLTASVKAGDKLHFMVRCATDGVVTVDPRIAFTPGQAQAVDFQPWDDAGRTSPQTGVSAGVLFPLGAAVCAGGLMTVSAVRRRRKTEKQHIA